MRHLIIAASVTSLLGFLVPQDAFAHGGGLDRHGCHNETATGGYHCHRGGSSNNGIDVDWKTVGAVVGGLLVLGILVRAMDTDQQPTYRGLAPELAADQTGNAYAGARWRLHF